MSSRRHLAWFACFTFAGCGTWGDSKSGPSSSPSSSPNTGASVAKDDPLGEPVLKVAYLDQGWSPAIRSKFYSTSQGSEIIPYRWFLALEQADSTAPFRDDRNILKFRYLPRVADPSDNPDGLPVGFVADSGSSRDWFGLTCAACHTAEIRYKDTAYRIDGAPTRGDVRALLSSLIESMQKTLADPDKFARFAPKVLEKRDSPANRDVLKKRLQVMIQTRVDYNVRNFPGYDPTRPAPPPDDYGRLDAFGAIINEVYYHAEKAPAPATATSKPADAPVSYPFLWDTNDQNITQWVGIPNGGLNTLARNVGEVLGVFADYKVPDEHFLFGYTSTVRVAALLDLEKWVGQLRPPAWPDDFPTIDRAKASKGQALYATYCLKCHVVIAPDASDRTNLAFLGGTGTDPGTFDNIFKRFGPSGKLEGSFANVVGIPDSTRFGDKADALTMLRNEVIGTILGDWRDAPTDVLAATDMRRRPPQTSHALTSSATGPQYKARALDGIWATAPYLHNGSVPNLRELLLPAAQRSKSFSIGIKTFDPATVGYVLEAPGFPKFRVLDDAGKPIPGNSNAGHEIGTNLGDIERDQLLEYLKTL